ncbi:MAG: hypothetical protein M1817_005870 [Caeruleum heppii]|nr:MAG: hypothetical protein M1817_005870 [Caeruleum heppii]
MTRPVSSPAHAVRFSTSCPPDIQPNTRILTLCGVNDEADGASPQEDGWFLSDFYLFHHLLRGIGPQQSWFTMVEPAELVRKYQEYAHGNSFDSRRVVLDGDILNNFSTRPQDLRILPKERVLTEFLETLHSESRLAVENDQPVLVLIFGHGDEDTHGIFIGPIEDNRFLDMGDFCRFAGAKVQLCTVVTACFAGNWATRPSLNYTVLTAAGEVEAEYSEKWPESKTIGRASGTIYASAITESLMEMEKAEIQGKVETYRELTCVVETTLIDDLDRMGTVHNMKFSAQDDGWEREWRKRSGIPLQYYENRLNELRVIPPEFSDNLIKRDPKMPHPNDEDDMGSWEAFSNLQEQDQEIFVAASLRGRFGGTMRTYRRVVRAKAHEYLGSYPARDSMANNHRVHHWARKSLEGDLLDFPELYRLHRSLEYRLSLMKTATAYLVAVGVPAPIPCVKWDADESLRRLDEQQHGRYHDISCLVGAAHLFPRPTSDQGRPYNKQHQYITYVLLRSGLTPVEIEGKVDEMKVCQTLVVEQLTANIERSHSMRGKGKRLLGSLTPTTRVSNEADFR